MGGLIVIDVMQRYATFLSKIEKRDDHNECDSCMAQKGVDMRYWELNRAEEGVGF